MSLETELPSGTVTFLFTDIEGSTGLLKQLGRERYGEVLSEHRRLLREAFAAAGGHEVDTQGDAFFVAFGSATEAISAAAYGQRLLRDHAWPDGVEVRVRMGVHTGEAAVSDGRYHGVAVHRGSRICDAGHGGQVLVSQTTHDLLLEEEREQPTVVLRDLGAARLKGLERPIHLYQLVGEGQERFPPLRTVGSGRSLPRSRRGRLLLAGVGVVAAGTAVAAVLATTGGSAAVELAPNSVAIVDAKSGHVVGDVPLPFTPTGVEAGGDLVWVLNAAGKTVSAIDPKSLRLGRTFGLDGSPTGQWSTGTTDWVALPGKVEMVDADSGNTTPISLPKPPTGSPCVATVTGAGTTVWVAEARSLAQLDRNGNVLRKLPLAAVPGFARLTCYGVRHTGGKLFAVRDPDESVGQLDPTTGTFTPIIAELAGLSGTAQSGSWAAGFGSLWIPTRQQNPRTLRTQGSLARIDAGSGQVVSKTTVGGNVGGVAVDPTSGVWTVDLAGEKLVEVDPKTAQVVRHVALEHFACCSLAAGHGRIWIVLQSP